MSQEQKTKNNKTNKHTQKQKNKQTKNDQKHGMGAMAVSMASGMEAGIATGIVSESQFCTRCLWTTLGLSLNSETVADHQPTATGVAGGGVTTHVNA